MRKLVLFLLVLALVEVGVIALLVPKFIAAVAGQGSLSLRDILGLIAIVGLPPLMVYLVRLRLRNNSIRKSELARIAAIAPGNVAFAAQPTQEFVAQINNFRRFGGSPPITNNGRPLIVSFSNGFMSIRTTGTTTYQGDALLLPTTMIAGISVETVRSPIPGTLGKAKLETLHVAVVNVPQLDLFIPVQTRDFGNSSRKEVEDIAAAVSAKIVTANRR